MSRANDQAFPRHEKHFDGLTVREWLVGQALQGYTTRNVPADTAGSLAVYAADAAIAAMKERT